MAMMRNTLIATLIAGSTLLSGTDALAARVVVRRNARVTRVHVTVHPGFPLRRTFPDVVVRTATVRVAPRVYVAPVVFGARIVTLPAARAWTATEGLDRDEGWTEFTMNVDRRGSGLLLEIDRGAAQISFAEVVFENGDTQVVDFNDHIHATGVYSLIDFKDGRKVDHVRIVAKADSRTSDIKLHLLS